MSTATPMRCSDAFALFTSRGVRSSPAVSGASRATTTHVRLLRAPPPSTSSAAALDANGGTSRAAALLRGTRSHAAAFHQRTSFIGAPTSSSPSSVDASSSSSSDAAASSSCSSSRTPSSSKNEASSSHQLITFFRFAEVADPMGEVEVHHAYIAANGLELRGRIYINEQGINAQISGRGTDSERYARWVESRPAFAGMRVSVYPVDAQVCPCPQTRQVV